MYKNFKDCLYNKGYKGTKLCNITRGNFLPLKPWKQVCTCKHSPVFCRNSKARLTHIMVQNPLKKATDCLKKLLKIGLARLPMVIIHCLGNLFPIARPSIHSFVLTAASALSSAQSFCSAVTYPDPRKGDVNIRASRFAWAQKKGLFAIPSRCLHSRLRCTQYEGLPEQGREAWRSSLL